MRDCARAHPSKFIGVYSVDLLAPDAPQQAARWQAEGLAGMRFFIAGHTAADHATRLDDPRARPAWQYASDHGIPVCVQIRADGYDVHPLAFGDDVFAELNEKFAEN